MKFLRGVLVGIIFWIWFCLIGFMVASCAQKTPVETAFTEVQTSIVAIKDSLIPECQTEETMRKIEEVEWKRQTAEQVCQAKIKDVQTKYERAIWVIFFVILSFFVKFFIKK